MPETEEQYPEGVEPSMDPNGDPDLSQLLFMGQPVELVLEDGSARTRDDILEDLRGILANASTTEAPVDEIATTNLDDLVDSVADVMSTVAGELVSESDIRHLSMMDPDMEPSDEAAFVPADDYAEVGLPTAPESEHVVYYLPETFNGADYGFTKRDFASDDTSYMAADISQGCEDGAFTDAEGDRQYPNPKGFIVAGKDENDKLGVWLVTPVVDEQDALADLNDVLGSATISISSLGYASDEERAYLVIPLYNEGAGGCGNTCSGSSLVPLELNPGNGAPGNDYPYDPPYSTSSWNISDGSGASNCGFKIQMVEYVSLGSGELYHRMLSFDNCGTLVSVGASTETTHIDMATVSHSH